MKGQKSLVYSVSTMRTKISLVALALAAVSISLNAQAPASGYLLPPAADDTPFWKSWVQASG